ncbi:hypothetical protein GF407_03250 [candidate division KSB1 bacterium]|nr:hypothetical protein [candidate division KSB1 bacterium]
MENSKKKIYMGIIIIALGIVMTSAMQGIPRPLGLVFIGIGGIFFILGMRQKKKDENSQDQ